MPLINYNQKPSAPVNNTRRIESTTGAHLCYPVDETLMFTPCPECQTYWRGLISRGRFVMGVGWMPEVSIPQAHPHERALTPTQRSYQELKHKFMEGTSSGPTV